VHASGRGQAVQPWIGEGLDQPIGAARLEGVPGSGEIAGIASHAGLDPTTTTGKP